MRILAFMRWRHPSRFIVSCSQLWVVHCNIRYQCMLSLWAELSSWQNSNAWDSLPFSIPSPSSSPHAFPFHPHIPFSPHLSLLGGSAVRTASRVWGRAPAANAFLWHYSGNGVQETHLVIAIFCYRRLQKKWMHEISVVIARAWDWPLMHESHA